MGNKQDIVQIIYNAKPLELVIVVALAAICFLIGGVILLCGEEVADNIKRSLSKVTGIRKVVYWIAECVILAVMFFVGIPLFFISVFVLAVTVVIILIRSGAFLFHIVANIFYKIIAWF